MVSEHIDFHFCEKGHVVFDKLDEDGMPVMNKCRRKECVELRKRKKIIRKKKLEGVV